MHLVASKAAPEMQTDPPAPLSMHFPLPQAGEVWRAPSAWLPGRAGALWDSGVWGRRGGVPCCSVAPPSPQWWSKAQVSVAFSHFWGSTRNAAAPVLDGMI